MSDMVVSTGGKPGIYDAMETAKPDEPVFTLQGGDPFASATVLHWASLARKAGIDEERPAESEKLLRKAHAAEVVAWAMRDYQRGRHDEPAPPPTPPTVVAADNGAADRMAVLTRGVTRIHNSIAEATDFANALDDIEGVDPEAISILAHGVRLFKQAADRLEPRRMMRESN